MALLTADRVSRRQAAQLIATTIFSTSSVLVPQYLFFQAGRGAPWAVLLATVAALPIAWMLFVVGRHFDGLSVPEYLELALGRYLGKFLALIYLVSILWLVTCCLFQFAMLIQLSIMPSTPASLFWLTGLVLVGYMAWQGLEVIARSNEIIQAITLLAGAVVLILSLGNAQVFWLKPILPPDWGVVVNGAIYPLTFVGQVFLIGMWLPYVEKRQQALKAMLLGTAAGGLLLTTAVLMVLLNLGPMRAGDLLNPVLETLREIHYGPFISGLEVLGVPVWIAFIVIKAALGFFDLSLGLAQVLGLKNYRLTFLFWVPLLSLTPLLFHTILDLFRFLLTWWVDVLFPIGAFMPLLPYLVGRLRGIPR